MKTWTLRLGMLSLVLAGPAGPLAHTLDAPESVTAAADGSFSYEYEVLVGPDTALLGGLGWSGDENLPEPGFHGDCFCYPNCFIEPGDTLRFIVQGTLIDPFTPGRARNWCAFCDDPELSSFTQIYPHTLPAAPTTWGRLKAMYPGPGP